MKPAAPSPRFTIFGGPNGSGKSTAYIRFVRAGFDSGEGAVWAEQGTADLPRPELLKTRGEALKGLRAAEGITGDLEIREPRGSYEVVSPPAAGAGMK